MKLMPAMTPWMMPCTTRLIASVSSAMPDTWIVATAAVAGDQRDQPKRARADGPVGQVTIDADRAARERCCAETEADVDIG
jgi:hypothetical protein